LRRTAVRALAPVVVAGLLLAALVAVARPAPPPAPPALQPPPDGVASPPPVPAPAPLAALLPAPVAYSEPCPGAPVGASWRPLAVPGPPARALHVAAFDPRRGEALVLGGVGADNTVLDDLWAFSLHSEQWQEVAVDGERPAPRWAAAAVHDAVRDRLLLLFGNAAPATDEVWALDLGLRRWSPLGPFTTGPVARYDAAVATDGADRAWIYGGFAGPQFRPDTALGDLWELDLAAGTWRPLPRGGTPPPPTTNAGLAFHEGALYLLGGHDATGVTPGFWRYDLALQQWRPLPAGARPGAWTHHARASDAACADLLLLGGDDGAGADVPYLEAFRPGAGPALARLADAPAEVSRHHAAMAFDPVTRRLVLFGGWRGRQGSLVFLGDTWIYALGPDATAPAPPPPPAE
jgi:hypothetical protein